jgi:hypothetical protein
VFILSLSGQVARLSFLDPVNERDRLSDTCRQVHGTWAPIGSLVGRRYLAVAAYLAAVGKDHDNLERSYIRVYWSSRLPREYKCRGLALNRRLHGVGDATPGRRQVRHVFVDSMQVGYHTPCQCKVVSARRL